jgi:3-phenylpropionate/trans-cinnamate dioxygenase ferredoxin subunit
MSRWVDVGATDDFAEGAMKLVTVEGADLLVARVADDFYAADDRCPHMGGRLAMGTLEGRVVKCPRHNSRFDLSDGHVVQWTDWTGLTLRLAKLLKAPRPLRTYPVEARDGRVMVERE